jgi:prepilin-type N-terminal cleavage/methylation domain-containing protein/prepilin-type processing-associated H-X9-DG protein
MGRREGFTLVEMMIVITIIVLLVSLLLPALRVARQQAQRVVCMSNMRQVTQAFISYATDHEGVFLCPDKPEAQAGFASPSDTRLVVPALYPYVHDPRVFHCPGSPTENSVDYAPSEMLNGTWLSQLHPLKVFMKVPNASSTLAEIEEFDIHPKSVNNAGGFVVNPAPSEVWADVPAVPHGNGSCVTFLDGHCEFLTWSDHRTLAFPSGSHYMFSPGNPDLPKLQAVLGSN